MGCGEVEEFVSAMYDGEAVPQAAAEHIAHCVGCQQLLKSFAEIGTELRSLGSDLISEGVPERRWVQPRRSLTGWQKGWQMMRVPRIVFASLAVLLVVLGSRLAIVEVRAHEDGSVLVLKLKTPQGDEVACPVSLTDVSRNHCGGLSQLHAGTLAYEITVVRKEGDRVLLNIGSEYPSQLSSFGPKEAQGLLQSQHWFTTGETLALPLAGTVKLSMTGEWMDHMPVMLSQSLDPAANQFRVTSPVLLKNGKVAGDLKSLTAISDQPDQGIKVYLPSEGLFFFSPTPLSGAVPGQVELNRISFSEGEQTYQLIAGMPIARMDKVWVLHKATYKWPGAMGEGPVIGTGSVSAMR